MSPRAQASKTEIAAKRPRRSNAERSDETQRRAVAAAITCLHRLGFHSTTTSLVAEGLWVGGTLPLGYDLPPPNGERTLVLNPAEAETVRLIFRRYLELGSFTSSGAG